MRRTIKRLLVRLRAYRRWYRVHALNRNAPRVARSTYVPLAQH